MANDEENKDFHKEVEKEIIEIIENAHKSENKMSKEEIEKLRKELDINENFLGLLDNIDISASNYRVIVTIGANELLYDNGEFYIVETIDVRGKKKKISKKEAKDLYIEYFIRYQLNPILENKKIKAVVRDISKENHDEVEIEKEKKEEIKVQEEKQKEQVKIKQGKIKKEENDRIIE